MSAGSEIAIGDANVPVLQTSRLTRAFGGVKAVNDVSMQVLAGQVIGVIGPNGAGKSTLINLITGLLSVDEGVIYCDGADITDASAHAIAKAGLARTFQTSRLFAEMTVAENIDLAARFARKPTRRHIKGGNLDETDFINVLLSRFGLAEFRDIPANMLSYGHRRCLEIGRALALRPKIILLDEPVAGMTDGEAIKISKILREIARQGVAVIVVEHNMRFVVDLVDFIYVLNHGRVIAQGSPSTVLQSQVVIEAYLGGANVSH